MSKMDDVPHFIWIRSVGGRLIAQKWQNLSYEYDKHWKEYAIVAAYPITQDMFDNLKIEHLEVRYPMPVLADA